MASHDVQVWGSMKPHTGGEGIVTLDGETVGALLRDLVERYPGVEAQAADGIAVSIDGRIYQNSHEQPVPEGAEIVLLPRLKGG